MGKTRAGIIGVSGYTGLELVKLLINHPYFELTYIANSEGETRLDILHSGLKGVCEMDVSKASPKDVAQKCDLAFLALPHKSAMEFARELVELGVKVVDLSADYRLSLENYEKAYCEHIDKEHLKEAVYGLPEFFRDKTKPARLVANPGCYPTATLLGLVPFLEYIDENSPIFVDAKSGVSGAGKKCVENTHFVNVNENLFAYNPISHRHAPEITEKAEMLSSKKLNITFVPHLLPLTRGMLVSTYATLKSDIEPLVVLKNRYQNEEFVRIRETPVRIKDVAGTHFCDIYAAKNGKAIFINSTIDNLLRGASSQAMANANIICGYDENVGLPRVSYIP